MPGGDAPVDSIYYPFAKKVFEYVKQKNADGLHYPVWGTCQGFQNLVMFVAEGGQQSLQNRTASKTNFNIDFVVDPGTTKLFSSLQEEALLF